MKGTLLLDDSLAATPQSWVLGLLCFYSTPYTFDSDGRDSMLLHISSAYSATTLGREIFELQDRSSLAENYQTFLGCQ